MARSVKERRLQSAKRLQLHILPYIAGYEGIVLREALELYIETWEGADDSPAKKEMMLRTQRLQEALNGKETS